MEEEAEDKKNNEEKKGDDPMYFSDDLVSDDDKFTRNSRTELDYFFAESFKVFSEKKWYQKQQL
jgi:DNA-binding ferritin-like protein (Dps family)